MSTMGILSTSAFLTNMCWTRRPLLFVMPKRTKRPHTPVKKLGGNSTDLKLANLNC